MDKTFTIQEIRNIIHKELANFVVLSRLTRNQERQRQVLLKFGSTILLKLMAEFEK